MHLDLPEFLILVLGLSAIVYFGIHVLGRRKRG
jgi:hypothetical protein